MQFVNKRRYIAKIGKLMLLLPRDVKIQKKKLVIIIIYVIVQV